MLYIQQYNSEGKECLYFRKINHKDIQWWSFHELSKDEIMGEITFHIYQNKYNPLAIRTDSSLIKKEDMFHKRKKEIIKLIESNKDLDDFHYIYIKFRDYSILLFKKGYERY